MKCWTRLRRYGVLKWLVWIAEISIVLYLVNIGIVSFATTKVKHPSTLNNNYVDTHKSDWAEWKGPMKSHGDTAANPASQKEIGEVSQPKQNQEKLQRLDWKPHHQPVNLQLKLPDSILHSQALSRHSSMYHKYGFNLNLSNHIPLDHSWPDFRNDECKERKFPPVEKMPKVSVIIIFYNEPLSTLLRNVISVLNRSPPILLGEVLLIDDHSQMDEHAYLTEHVQRLQSDLPPGKVRLIRRDIHNGIVGARVRGAEEAKYPIILFLDSHAEVCNGWLEPLVSRIHSDRTRVVIPNIRGINIDTLELIPGGTWPPSRGGFTWRLSFDIVLGDPHEDLSEHDVDPKASATKTPVMPGGLFAIDRAFFFEIGAYDPEIMYYGAEHVELSFRAWMCGGSMEIVPCSNVGHIYREFDRFGVDPQLQGVNIGHFLNRNDARVAEVWLDEYKDIFFTFRPKGNMDLGDLSDRKALRGRSCPKSFDWYLKNVVRNQYIPDFNMHRGKIYQEMSDRKLCIDCKGRYEGVAQLEPCSNRQTQQFHLTSKGYIQTMEHYHHHLICLRVEVVSQVPCHQGVRWEVTNTSLLRSLDNHGMCLERGTASGDVLKYRQCSPGKFHQKWEFRMKKDKTGTLSGPDFDVCIDNMQKSVGAPGMYACHGYGTQRWQFTDDGKIRSTQHHEGSGVCIGFQPVLRLYKCLPDDEDFQWKWKNDDTSTTKRQLESVSAPGLCIEGTGKSKELSIAKCSGDTQAQRWTYNES